MIKLIDILKEISLGKPYQTQFNWKEDFLTASTIFPSDSTQVKIQIDGLTSDPGEYSLSFSTKNSSGEWNMSKTDPFDETSPAPSISPSEYLKILSTIGEALIDFLTKYSPKALEIEAWDLDPAKRSQKDIIYKGLFQSNKERINNAGYDFGISNGDIRLTRKTK